MNEQLLRELFSFKTDVFNIIKDDTVEKNYTIPELLYEINTKLGMIADTLTKMSHESR